MTKKAFFISLEGADGSGKSTQAKLLYNALRGIDIDVILTREPGGVKEAEDIRNLLIHSQNDWDNQTEILLLNAARTEHVNKLIKPSLENNKFVICDRFIDSTLVYQAFAKNLPEDDILNLHKILFNNFMPDLTIILNLDYNKMQERISLRNNNKFDYFENKSEAYLKSITKSYAKCAELFKDRCILLEADSEIEQIHKKILDIVLNKYNSTISS